MAARLGNRLSALELVRGDDFKYEVPTIQILGEPQVSQQSTEDIIARKRSILAQIELKASSQTNAPAIPSIPPAAPNPDGKADIPALKPRMSVLDQIELEPPKIKSEKNKLKQKDKTLEF